MVLNNLPAKLGFGWRRLLRNVDGVFSFLSGYHCFDYLRFGSLNFWLFVQVNPHTHQVKLCDFGSAKVLVSL